MIGDAGSVFAISASLGSLVLSRATPPSSLAVVFRCGVSVSVVGVLVIFGLALYGGRWSCAGSIISFFSGDCRVLLSSLPSPAFVGFSHRLASCRRS